MKYLILILALAGCADKPAGKLADTDIAGMPVTHYNLASCIDDGPALDNVNAHVYICQGSPSSCAVYLVGGTQHSPCGPN